jgi:hypothetical protein
MNEEIKSKGELKISFLPRESIERSLFIVRDATAKKTRVFRVVDLVPPSLIEKIKNDYKTKGKPEISVESFIESLKKKYSSLSQISRFARKIRRLRLKKSVQSDTSVVEKAEEKKAEVKEPLNGSPSEDKKPELKKENLKDLKERILARIKEKARKKEAVFTEAVKPEEVAREVKPVFPFTEAVSPEERAADEAKKPSQPPVTHGEKVKEYFQRLPSEKPTGFYEAVKKDEKETKLASVVRDLLKKLEEKEKELEMLKKAKEDELKKSRIHDLVSLMKDKGVEVTETVKKKLEALDFSSLETLSELIGALSVKASQQEVNVEGSNIGGQMYEEFETTEDLLSFMSKNWNKVRPGA